MLVKAASGLEKLMVAQPSGILKDSLVAQVSAALYYKSHVISNLMNSNSFKSTFKDVIYQQIEKDFGEYIDTKARMNPKSLHHVYEWNRLGNPTSRLFKIKRKNLEGLSFNIQYDFLLSKTFVKGSSKRHIFKNKAKVMEAGIPVKISPKQAERLVFDINGYTVFMPKGKSVFVKKPGGVAVKNAFETAYNYFFKSNLVNLSIKKSGFQKIFNSSISKALDLPADIKRVKYSFSPNTIRSQAQYAVNSAFGGTNV